jgi:hypothetical protein
MAESDHALPSTAERLAFFKLNKVKCGILKELDRATYYRINKLGKKSLQAGRDSSKLEGKIGRLEQELRKENESTTPSRSRAKGIGPSSRPGPRALAAKQAKMQRSLRNLQSLLRKAKRQEHEAYAMVNKIDRTVYHVFGIEVLKKQRPCLEEQISELEAVVREQKLRQKLRDFQREKTNDKGVTLGITPTPDATLTSTNDIDFQDECPDKATKEVMAILEQTPSKPRGPRVLFTPQQVEDNFASSSSQLFPTSAYSLSASPTPSSTAGPPTTSMTPLFLLTKDIAPKTPGDSGTPGPKEVLLDNNDQDVNLPTLEQLLNLKRLSSSNKARSATIGRTPSVAPSSPVLLPQQRNDSIATTPEAMQSTACLDETTVAASGTTDSDRSLRDMDLDDSSSSSSSDDESISTCDSYKRQQTPLCW